jgi:hypothetical protein
MNIIVMSKIQLINEFNEVFLELSCQLAGLFPNSIISNNLQNLKHVIGISKEKLMESFVIYVLPYKQQIDSGNQDFFINKSFDDLVNNSNDLIYVTELKKIWHLLDNTNKQVVQEYMKLLCSYALKYFNLIDSVKTV